MTTTAPAPAAPQPAPAPPPPPAPGGRRRIVAMGIWAAGFAVCMKLIGLPTDPVYAFLCLWAATIAWHSHRPLRSHLRFLRDWVAVVLLLVAYNFSRGFADNGVTPHALEMIAFDRAVFGQVPTLWLQHHLYDPAHVHWWDILASLVYFSHFVTALIVAVVLWLRNRARWASFVRRWFFLCAIGLATYFAYPAAPPWWAAKYGLLDPVARISTRGWTALGQHSAGNMLNVLQQGAANPVAAMPSLHSAFALLVVVFFLPVVRRRWWPLLLAYPLAMTFTLVYSGEHYMIDVFVGWAYVGITFVVVGLAERLWRRYRDAPAEARLPSGTTAGTPAQTSAPDQTGATGQTGITEQPGVPANGTVAGPGPAGAPAPNGARSRRSADRLDLPQEAADFEKLS